VLLLWQHIAITSTWIVFAYVNGLRNWSLCVLYPGTSRYVEEDMAEGHG